ncbi:hypothetical protein EKO27_g4680 [Xylaria grammica]|uniref:Peptidase A1 domain-containing protein n=1 Tax=Xylaria grammica TaxID=363999 RepID=A0A439D7P4_9PEZI|nr:hypothetical protein EKO27_g4680 [Xylaria grammica]
MLRTTLRYFYFLLATGILQLGEADGYGKLGLVSFPVQTHLHRPIDGRTDGTSSSLSGNSTSGEYYVQLYLGSPPNQTVEVLLDTDYNYFWVNRNCSNADRSSECKTKGSYDPDKSTTSHNTKVKGSVTYGDGTGANFTYYIDQQSLQPGLRYRYAGGQGVIIFGGVDTKKFSGQLKPNDILPPQGNDTYARYNIRMTDLGLTSSDGKFRSYGNSSNLVAVIDAGTTLTYLPDDLATAIHNDLQVAVHQTDGSILAPCTQRQNNSQLQFTFGSTAINVPFSELLTDKYNDTLCRVGVAPRGTLPRAVLGLSFLRSAYVVFDQTRGEIFMQQFVNCGKNERVIPISGANEIVGECNATTSSACTPTASPTTGCTYLLDHDTPVHSLLVRIIVSTFLGLLPMAFMAFLIYLWVRARDRNRGAAEEESRLSGTQDVGHQLLTLMPYLRT